MICSAKELGLPDAPEEKGFSSGGECYCGEVFSK